MAFFMAFACGESTNENGQARADDKPNDLIKITRAQFEQSAMQLGTLQEREFPIMVNATGMIDVPPENRSVVNATMGGYIKSLPLLVGDRVEKGQALLTIENPEFVTLQQDYLEVGQTLDYLKTEYERQKTMYDENITSQKSYLKAKSEYKTAEARHNGLRKQLAMLNISPAKVEEGNITSVTTIFAPISGSVTKVNVSKGSHVAPATSILEIIDNDHIHIELSVFEKDIMKVKKGQDILFKIPEASSDTFGAEVHLVGTSIGGDRTIKVHGHLKEEEENKFLTGMFVEAQIVTETTRAKALPSESIIDIDDKNYVLLLDKKVDDDYYFRKMEVRIGDAYQGYSTIKNADTFGPTDQFLTQGADNF
ncbi:membrane fusion protein, cobalt-zinc-cadmium efflux system [Pseudozobellia thermophila]|uniref:Membrane fusion protein, cobalt-zinc-cadmium efflux system n=2 Tax=Pseudozobellia thermophila TaxID=192903 RepID=A0A1M6IKY2_9FLAO|nr:membrane fusion protein, cobalt-zinc-cadmium efflux system [Pseudozobellia thermophila]